MRLLILAAGYGTRLSSLTRNIPKALLPLEGTPLINYLIEKIEDLSRFADIEEIVLVTNDRFYPQFRDWKTQCGFKNLRVINDGSTCPENRLGAIGDLYLSLSGEKDDWLVLGSDNFFDWDLKGFFDFSLDNKSFPVVGLYDIKDIAQSSHMGVVKLDCSNRIIEFEEKPENPQSTLVATCIYFFPASTVRLLEEYVNSGKHSDMLGVYISWLSGKVPVLGYTFSGYWNDIGTQSSYQSVIARIKKG